MEKMNFKISIDAPREKVWNVLWEDATYRQWTSVFSEGSHAVTDWKEGSKVLFLGSEEGSGMVSMIAANKLYEFMSIKHLGMIKDGVEDTESEEVKKWGNVYENYTLIDQNGKTDLLIEMDGLEEYLDFFHETWPKALDKVKELSENA